MDVVDIISAALNRKNELFTEYEECTRALLECEVDSMSDYITKRTQLANEIDKIDVQILQICDDTPRGALLGDVVANRCAYEQVPAEWKSLFDGGQVVLGTISRVVELEGLALARMKELRAELKKKISESQNTPKIARYLTGLSDQNDGEMFITDKA